MNKFFSLHALVMIFSVSLLGNSKPNIVLIYVDDLDFDQVSVYDQQKFPSYTGAKETGNLKELNPITANQNGRFLKVGEMPYHKNAQVLTPHIASLAEEGVTFNRFYLTSSTCTPSRYSLLTGRYASRAPLLLKDNPPGSVPLIAWNANMDPLENNLAKDLKSAGYKTALVGKWHLSNYDIAEIDFEKGFKGHHLNSEKSKKLLPHQLVGSYFPLTADYGSGEVQDELERIYGIMQRRVKRISGFDVVDRLYYANYGELPMPKHMKVHNLEWLTEGALNYIEDNKDNPFFLYFSITAPHGQYFEDWMEKDWRATPAGMLKEKPKGMPSRESVLQRIDKACLPRQNAMATWIDDSVGAILTKLKKSGLADNTMVLFVSDHQSRGKLTTYEGHRAPAIIHWPKMVNKGVVEEGIFSNIDILPTLLDLAKGQSPKGSLCDGQSFLPMLKGEKLEDWRESILLETSYSRAIVHKDWKYMANRPPQWVLDKMEEDQLETQKSGARRHVGWSGRTTNAASGMGIRFNADQDFPYYFDADQLYNLGEDVFEQKNIIMNPENKKRLEELKKKLESHINDLPHHFGEFGSVHH
ncbi:sulfatase-like hydrolase/transferase [Lentisphaera profundi]|uniref:Sulfatase-like hydrolase/transferase n=1 Tax=Lentisphaera profundi TaxID=1658616 RepID=A0ABY7VU25_9BACT|nr:sulfatase-like hydrolase/transferase [Lentisphaera profundi]WDE97411.1 sulfatase-like hydrolase/transferase [Lentisphaera profundi]